MAVSRRKLLTSAAAGSALAAVSSAELLSALASPASAASPPGDVVGKVSVGYQGWFACPGDGAPIGGWWHWSRDRFQSPSPSNTTIVSWPDMRELSRGYTTAYPNLGNGQPAQLFSSYDQQTVDTHFRWMQEYNCDTAALQRFNPMGDEGPTRDAMATKVRGAAERFGRKYYIMYDVTSWTNFQSEIKTDWATKMSAHTASPAYARQNGKPVVCIWGFGFNDEGRPFPPAPCLEVVNWFKAQGCYVIGGVPTYWRQGINDSRPGFLDVYHAFNMISPWMVGRTGTLDGLDWFYTNVNQPDQADCNARGIDYQPCVMPGDLSSGHRYHGDFYWRHFYNMVRVGAQGIYISMFDEFNEGNQIAKTSETQATTPAGAGIRALDEDGTFCSSDYYLRITADGNRMLKGQLALTPVRPTQPVVGGGDPPPTAPGNLTVTGKTTTSVSLSWTASTDNVGVVGYQVRQGTTVAGTPTGTSYTVTGLGPGTGYSFSVVARDTAGNVSPSSNLVTATTDAAPNTNLARGRATAESGHVQHYGSGNVVDGDAHSYWESPNHAFPQWVQVDLGTTTPVGRVVLKLPPLSAWGARTQTLAVRGSTNGSAFGTLSASAGRRFDPATGNTVTITFTATPTRYVRLEFTGNTGWPAGQVSEFEVYSG
ncbi:galactose-binding domain-containing protein [Plantactinospora soyae]|uniref:Chitodextrinase n=1 Tax=Plantactinospora soyae TaxID=1544732 RepID=A0A927R0S0_9ACTN|nr:discoidin domain-containing protein [Plantactinospora soyae]MBE1491895.1 chitodextrinase [Plantactinospora soyae]